MAAMQQYERTVALGQLCGTGLHLADTRLMAATLKTCRTSLRGKVTLQRYE